MEPNNELSTCNTADGVSNTHVHQLTCHQQHVGSFLRPPHLVNARMLHEEGKISDAELREAEDKAIKTAVELQTQLGFHEFNDGEFLRLNFWETFFSSLQGFTISSSQPFNRLLPLLPWGLLALNVGSEPGLSPGQTLHLSGKIEHSPSQSINLAELQRLKSLVPESRWASIKLTLISPLWHWIRYKKNMAWVDSPFYNSDEEYFADLEAAFRAEIQCLYDGGLRNLQVDIPEMSFFCDERLQKGWEEEGMDVPDLIQTEIKVLNQCLRDVPHDMVVSLHICRGNFNSLAFAAGSYELIAKELFTSLPAVSTYYLEFDTPDAGPLFPLRFLPSTKNVILGLVTTKTGKLESFRTLKERLLKAAGIIAEGAGQTQAEALKRIGVSPQCGFESARGGNKIDEVGMLLKLMLIRDVVQDVFGEEAGVDFKLQND